MSETLDSIVKNAPKVVIPLAAMGLFIYGLNTEEWENVIDIIKISTSAAVFLTLWNLFRDNMDKFAIALTYCLYSGLVIFFPEEDPGIVTVLSKSLAVLGPLAIPLIYKKISE